MRPLRSMVVFATATLVTLGIMGLSNAQRSPDAGGEPLVAHFSEPIPAPVIGEDLFLPVLANSDTGRHAQACISADDALTILALDVEQVGGRIFMMSDGVQQDFSDYWRRLVGTAPADVSLVLAHVVPGRGGDAMVDLVEIGEDGCALSRTLLSATDWLDLIERSGGVEI